MMSGYDLALVLAVLIQGLGTLFILFVLGRRRLPLVASGKIALHEIALSQEPWPEGAKKASNAFDNQFQLPVLFYVAAAIAVFLGAGWPEALIGWAFVLTRSLHAFIHLTGNNLPRRFGAYTAGYLLLCLLWVWLIGRTVLLLGHG